MRLEGLLRVQDIDLHRPRHPAERRVEGAVATAGSSATSGPRCAAVRPSRPKHAREPPVPLGHPGGAGGDAPQAAEERRAAHARGPPRRARPRLQIPLLEGPQVSPRAGAGAQAPRRRSVGTSTGRETPAQVEGPSGVASRSGVSRGSDASSPRRARRPQSRGGARHRRRSPCSPSRPAAGGERAGGAHQGAIRERARSRAGSRNRRQSASTWFQPASRERAQRPTSARRQRARVSPPIWRPTAI